MPCNFLLKLDNEDKYKHEVIEGCRGTTTALAAVHFFRKRYPTLSVKQLEQNPDRKDVCRFVWVKTIEGVAIVEEKHEISIGEVNVLKDPKLPAGRDNFIKGRSFVSEVVESLPLKLLPFFQGDVDPLT